MGSSLVVPKVGHLIPIVPANVVTVNGSPQIRIVHNKEIDAWQQVGKNDTGFIVWLDKSYNPSHNTVRIMSIAKTGTSAWGKSFAIHQSV